MWSAEKIDTINVDKIMPNLAGGRPGEIEIHNPLAA